MTMHFKKPMTLKAYLWPYANPFDFPEQTNKRPLSGICFSGGGNRAYSAAIGQLRALHHLGLLSRCDYISAVSGGSWAATIFSYAQQSTETLLGPLIATPQAISLDSLNYTESNYVGNAASENLFHQFHENLKQLPKHQVWIQAVADVYLKPYHLGQTQYFFTESQETLFDIKKNNPTLTTEQFHLKHQKPHLIINSTLLWPDHHVKLKNRLLIQTTSQYTGILKPIIQSTKKYFLFKIKQRFGGGFLQSFAFNSIAPSKPINLHKNPSCASIKQPTNHFSLADMVGSSSAFFASIAEDIPITRKLIPQFHYWPIEKKPKTKNRNQFLVGDGGTLENYGILPLLQRQVEHIVVFINSETPIKNPYENADGKWHGIDIYLPPLFGLYSDFWKPHEGKPTTQVFNSNFFHQLICQFQHCIDQGAAVAAFTDLPVKKNQHFNIYEHCPDGTPYRVKILWLYNNPAKQWEQQLPPSLQQALNKKIGNLFPNFPNYSTIDENFSLFDAATWKDWGGLSIQQVNLLTHFSAWNVLQQKEHLTKLLNKEKK